MNNLDRYIEQLISELRKATFNVKPPHEIWNGADPDDEGLVEDLSYAEEYIYGKKEPVSSITGIDAATLPPSEQLSEKQQELLASELEKLLNYFNFHLDFPPNFPIHLRYPFICDFWKEERVALSFGESHIEFCDYDEDNCPFPGYCTSCEEYRKEEEEGVKASETDFDGDGLLLTPEEMEAWAESQGIKKSEPGDDLPFFQEEEEYVEDISGLYDDDGNKIEPDSIPVPGLCIICKHHDSDFWEDNLLCLMNRNDQKNNPDFECGSFEKK